MRKRRRASRLVDHTEAGPSAQEWLAGDRLGSWKEIAAHLSKDVRTVQRWERLRGLPLHRLPGGHRRAIYALKSELDEWAQDSPVDSDNSRFLVRGWAGALLIVLLSLATIGALIFFFLRE